jgi:hypothetical protein
MNIEELVFAKFNPPDPKRTKHGSRRMYSIYGCRCKLCKEAIRIESAKRRLDEKEDKTPKFSVRQVEFIKDIILREYFKTSSQPQVLHRYMKRLRKRIASLNEKAKQETTDSLGKFKL